MLPLCVFLPTHFHDEPIFFASRKDYFDITVTGKKGDAASFSKEAVEGGYSTVFACGGDGTINETASPLLGSETALAIIPGGSGNGLARALGLPTDPAEAIRVLATGKPRRIDAGTICGRHFLSTAGLGFDAFLSKRYNERSAAIKRRGILPYITLALKEYWRYEPGTVRIMWEGHELSLSLLLLTIANTEQFGGNAIVAPGARADDGLLDVCMIPKLPLFKAAMCLPKLFNGRIDTVREYTRIRTSSLEVLRQAPGPVHADGEPFEGGRRIEIEVIPGGFKVWAG